MDYNSCSKSSGSEGKRHDRFSRDYKNVLKRHDRFTLAPRPQQQPAGVTFDEATRIAFKKFRSVKKFPTGSRRSETAAQVELAVSEGGRLNEGALRKPMRATTKEWWAIHTYIYYNAANRFYGWLGERCTPRRCPKMTAGPRYEFKWSDGKQYTTPRAIPAVEYITYVMEWVEYQWKDERIFPSADGEYYSPSRFIPVARDMFRRLFRVMAHILCHHYDDLKEAAVEREFVAYTRYFLDFFDHHDLVEERALKPITRSILWFTILQQDNASKRA